MTKFFKGPAKLSAINPPVTSKLHTILLSDRVLVLHQHHTEPALYQYQPTTSHWLKLPEPPTNGAVQTNQWHIAQLDHQVFVLRQSHATAELLLFDAISKKWLRQEDCSEQISDLLIEPNSIHADWCWLGCGHSLYLLGRANKSIYFYRYEPSTHTWQTLPLPEPINLQATAYLALNLVALAPQQLLLLGYHAEGISAYSYFPTQSAEQQWSANMMEINFVTQLGNKPLTQENLNLQTLVLDRQRVVIIGQVAEKFLLISCDLSTQQWTLHEEKAFDKVKFVQGLVSGHHLYFIGWNQHTLQLTQVPLQDYLTQQSKPQKQGWQTLLTHTLSKSGLGENLGHFKPSWQLAAVGQRLFMLGNSPEGFVHTENLLALPMGDMQLYDYHRPGLKDGDYEISVVSKLNWTNGNPPAYDDKQLLQMTHTMTVSGLRFSIPVQDIHGFYPPANSCGMFHTNLPYLILNKAVLPWERPLVGADEKTPWLALLVLEEQELQTISSKTLSSTGTFDCSVAEFASASTQVAILKPQLALNNDEKNLTCQCIQLSKETWQIVMPTMAELPYLAHCREMNRTDKSTLSEQQDNGSFAVIFAKRFPKDAEPSAPSAPVNNVVHLVSLEGWQDYLAGVKVIPAECKSMQMVSLTSWKFQCQAELQEDFAATVEGIVQSANTNHLLQLPDSAEPLSDAVKLRLTCGFVPLPYRTRTGEATLAWYRGPFLPLRPADPNTPEPQDFTLPLPVLQDKIQQQSYPNSSGFMLYDETQGVFDQSYATAWELGRALALASTSFVQALLDYRRKAHQAVSKQTIQHTLQLNFHPHLQRALGTEHNQPQPTNSTSYFLQFIQGGLTEHISSLTKGQPPSLKFAQVSSPSSSLSIHSPWQHKLQQNRLRAIPEILFPDVPVTILNWLKDLRLLKPIPFDYLVAEERLLPNEAIRFFQVDRNWLAMLVEGALSLGFQNISADNTLLDDKAVNNYIKEQLSHALIDTPDAQSGFLLRSSLVKDWPGLAIRAIQGKKDKPAQRIVPCRKEYLAPNVLLCLFPQIPDQLILSEPQENLGFGLEGEAELSEAKLLLREVTGNNIGKPTSEQLVIKPYLISETGRSLNLNPQDEKSLINYLAKTLNSAMSPAKFALQWIKVPRFIEFDINPAKTKSLGENFMMPEQNTLQATSSLNPSLDISLEPAMLETKEQQVNLMFIVTAKQDVTANCNGLKIVLPIMATDGAQVLSTQAIVGDDVTINPMAHWQKTVDSIIDGQGNVVGYSVHFTAKPAITIEQALEITIPLGTISDSVGHCDLQVEADLGQASLEKYELTLTKLHEKFYIRNFNASPATATPEQTVTLSWETNNPIIANPNRYYSLVQMSWKEGKADVSGLTSCTFPGKLRDKILPSVTKDTVFTLTAYRGDNEQAPIIFQDQKEVTIKQHYIAQFSADKRIELGANLQLSWATKNVDYCVLKDSQGTRLIAEKLPANETNYSINLPLSKTTVLVLEAYLNDVIAPQDSSEPKTVTVYYPAFSVNKIPHTQDILHVQKFLQDSRLYVAYGDILASDFNGYLQVLDGDNLNFPILKTLSLPGVPIMVSDSQLADSQQSNRLFLITINDATSSSIVVIDTSKPLYPLLKSIPIAGHVSAAMVFFDNRLFAAIADKTSSTGKILVIDTASPLYPIVKSIPFDGPIWALTRCQNRLYVSFTPQDFDNHTASTLGYYSVIAIDKPDYPILITTLGSAVIDFTFSPKGDRLYIEEGIQNLISVTDTTQPDYPIVAKLRLTENQMGRTSLVVSPQGNRLYVSIVSLPEMDSSTFFVIDTTKPDYPVLQQHTLPYIAEQLVISPSGDSVYCLGEAKTICLSIIDTDKPDYPIIKTIISPYSSLNSVPYLMQYNLQKLLIFAGELYWIPLQDIDISPADAQLLSASKLQEKQADSSSSCKPVLDSIPIRSLRHSFFAIPSLWQNKSIDKTEEQSEGKEIHFTPSL